MIKETAMHPSRPVTGRLQIISVLVARSAVLEGDSTGDVANRPLTGASLW